MTTQDYEEWWKLVYATQPAGSIMLFAFVDEFGIRIANPVEAREFPIEQVPTVQEAFLDLLEKFYVGELKRLAEDRSEFIKLPGG